MLSYYTQHAEVSFSGPNVRPQIFRRLDASPEGRLTLWDLGGVDACARPLGLAVIPTDDFSPTDAQIANFGRSLSPNSIEGISDREERGPNLSALLSTSLHASQYGVGGGGPLAYHTDRPLSALWQLLDDFASLPDFEHPKGHLRQLHLYRHTVREMHSCLHHHLREAEARSTNEELTL